MTITVELPEDIATHLSAMGENLSRAALEGLGLEQYRAGKLTPGAVAASAWVRNFAWSSMVF